MRWLPPPRHLLAGGTDRPVLALRLLSLRRSVLLAVLWLTLLRTIVGSGLREESSPSLEERVSKHCRREAIKVGAVEAR
jgi:hypothetical protein